MSANPSRAATSGIECRATTALSVDQHASPEAKIALFRALFRGRDDVYARRFESRRTGRHGYQPACGPGREALDELVLNHRDSVTQPEFREPSSSVEELQARIAALERRADRS